MAPAAEDVHEALLEVVGGSSKGGILVRKEKDVSSAELPERLSKGSLVKVLEHEAGRIRYELVSGAGPSSGWVSTHFHDKALLAEHQDVAADAEEQAMQWYGDMFAVAEETPEKKGRQSFQWATTFPKPQHGVKEQLAKELNSEAIRDDCVEAAPKQESGSKRLQLTFGYPSGTADPPCFARFDVRDEVCRRFAGLRHGQVVKDSASNDRELVVVGVKIDLQSGEECLWLQPQDLGRAGTVSFKSEDLQRLTPVYKGITQTIRKRVDLSEVSFTSFEAVEDSDGEGILLCTACRLPVGTSLYSDACGNALHAECMAQRVQCEMREKEDQVRKKDAAKKKEARADYAIGWSASQIPLNDSPASKLSLDPLPRGMCCLMLQETSEGRSVNVVPTVDPASAVNLEYLSIALKVRYTEGREPTFSLDPVLADGGSGQKMQAKCFEPKWLSGTSAGEVLFQSDYHLKELSMGEYEQPIVGMKSCFDYSTWEAGEDWHAREWYVVRKAEMHMSEDNVLIPFLKMGVEAREQTLGAEGLEDKPITRADHPLALYAQEFTENFDLIAERKSVVNHLRELAKASLLAKFLLESGVELDDTWLNLAGEAGPEGHMEIPQLWNERNLAQIHVQEGKIRDPAKLSSTEHHGVYGGVKFGLDRFRLGGTVTSRPGLRAAPSVAVRAAMPTLSMSDVRSMGMLVASMQGKGVAPPPPPGEEVEGVPGAPAAARPSMAMIPGMAMRGAAPMGPAPVRPSASAGALARQMQGMLVTKPGLDGRRARLDVPSLHGVDLNLDRFELDEAVRVQSQMPEGALVGDVMAGANISKAFWSNLSSDKSVFNSEDQCLLKQVFNPNLSDRRDEGDSFTPPDPSAAYIEKLRRMVKREEKVRQQRRELFFSPKFVASNPGPVFPYSWNSTFEISSGGKSDSGLLKLRPDYLAQASMFDHALKSAKPVFDKMTEDGLRFRTYQFGTLEVRTTQEHDGEEVIGAVFSSRPDASASGRRAEAQEKITKVSEYVQSASKDVVDALSRRSYLVLETSEGNLIVTEKRRDGTITWEENPEDLEDRNSLAKFIRSTACSCSKKAIVTVGDVEAFKASKGKLHGASLSACKRYVQEAFNCARGLTDRRDSGFGSRSAWSKGKVAKNTQKETRKQTRKAEVAAMRAAAQDGAGAKAGKARAGRRVIDPVVVGSWDDWTYGEVMAFDDQQRCYCLEMQVGDSGSESFQILCEGDWDMCLHPDRDGAALCGPDADGHGKNWTIGEQDQAAPGTVFRICLKVDDHGVAQKVEWEPLGVVA
mmetsp:Transcript_123591/g.384783  ORF Transcript_123591/g.384783 Transcript_123591/m.384783 type:complete len:1284 (+) Transcript_123591:36-3887(+)|eukprot:CAMPEP_0204572882 /NCGR_PEP_ID=MMETSP0661-20131031/39701_1 /ASSEMBLY_ACC=CAM_ASM_000606 /TAXON_ID=109239 /ORGANISM="Alexandrium margalefi, Strain AMGDE01CS-322" /LENGTH=1283 /DNA_ID=CAMNT_0051581259 /DNA_START=36 /DNA_END=3887 /DNA_ORIENTATION=-